MVFKHGRASGGGGGYAGAHSRRNSRSRSNAKPSTRALAFITGLATSQHRACISSAVTARTACFARQNSSKHTHCARFMSCSCCTDELKQCTVYRECNQGISSSMFIFGSHASLSKTTIGLQVASCNPSIIAEETCFHLARNGKSPSAGAFNTKLAALRLPYA